MCGEKDYDYGIALLRLCMCFSVVLIHFWLCRTPFWGSNEIGYAMQFAVPVFMVLSFLLTHEKILAGDKEWI